MAVQADHVLFLAAGIFGVAPTRALTYDLMTRKDYVALANELGVSQYARDVFGVSNQAKAEKLAENLLGSAVSADVKTAATGALKGMLDANGGNVGAAGLEGILFLSRTSDAKYTPAWTQLQNRVAVAQAYVDSANPAETFPLTSVTQDTATRDAVIANIKSIADTAPLTVRTDTLVANKFSAGLDYTPGGTDRVNTLQDEDTLVGTGVNPTLNATLGNANDNGGTTIHPTLRGVETINVAFSGTNGATGAVNVLDLQDSTGIKSANITRVSQVNGDVSFDNLTAVTESLSLNNTSVNTNSVEFSFVASAVSGAQDSTKITLNNANTRNLVIEQNTSAGAAFTGAVNNTLVPTEGFETINMVSSGSANTVGQLWAEDLQTLNISGDKNLTIGATTATVNPGPGTTVVEAARYNDGFGRVNGSLTAVNAAELTGNLDVTFGGELNAIKDNTSGVNMAVTVTGGKGNDIVRLNNDTVGTTDLIDGGEGNNTLVLVSNAVVNAAGTAAAPVATVKNVQSLEVRTGHDAGAAPVGAAAADIVTVNADAFDKLEKIFVRNEGQIQVGAAWNPATEGMTVNLNNLTAAQGTAITVAHGTTGNNGVINNVINANLKSSTGTSDTVGVTIVDGVNNDLRFNFQLQTNVNDPATTALERVENVTLTDSDTESNTVDLVNSAQNTSTITLKGGQAGKFLNLDSNGARLTAGSYGTNFSGYGLEENGAEGSFAQNAAGTAIATADTAVNAVISTVDYRVLNNGAGADVRLIAENIVAGEHIGDVIVRLGDVTRSNGVSSQAITTGTGNDTLIFDAQGVKNAGYTSGDTVKAGTGSDTLVIDGDTSVAAGGIGNRIEVQKSEWDNTTGIDTLRLAGNQGVANAAGIVAATAGGYYVEIDNEFVKQTDAGNNLTIINNDGDLAVNSESSLVLNLRPLAQTSNVTFVGANGNAAAVGIISSNRLQTEDNSVNALMKLDGGDTDVATANNTGNNNVLEVFNNADVSINDLSNTKNFGRIESTNDTAVAQNLKLVLNDTVMDQLVDSNHAAANTAGNVERLVVVANNNVNVAAAVANLNIDASAVTNKFGLDVLVGRGTTNTIVGTAGADKVVVLGNYTAAEATADGHAAAMATLNTTNFLNANALTAANIAANGTAYKGVDGIAGTADDVLLAYTGTFNLGAAGQGDTIETFGGVDLTGATIAAGTTIIAHSSVRLTDKQLNDLAGITFVGTGAHGLQIADDTSYNTAPNLSKVTVQTTGATLGVQTATGVAATTGSVSIPSGNTAPTVTTGVTFGTNGGAGAVVTGDYTLTAGIDKFNGTAAAVGDMTSLSASFGGVTATAPASATTSKTISTAVANLTSLDTLAFGTGTADQLTFTNANTYAIGGAGTTAGTHNVINGATISGLEVIQLANEINNFTIDQGQQVISGDSGLTVKGGTAQDIIAITANAAATTAGATLNIQAGGGSDQLTFAGSAAGITADGGDGDDSFIFDTVTNAKTVVTLTGGAGTDTLKLTTASQTVADDDLQKIAVEHLWLSGGTGTVTLGTWAKTNGVNKVTQASGTTTTTVADTFLIGVTTGTLSVVGGTGADTLKVSSGANLAKVASFAGGDGNDVIEFTAAATDIVDSQFANVTSVKTLTLTGASTAVLGTNATTAGIDTVTAGAGNTSITSTQTALTVAAAAMTANTYTLGLAGSANYTVTGADVTTLTVSGTGTSHITFADLGTDDAATLAITGSGNATVVGGAAGDTITVTGLATASQTFTGSVAKFNITAGAGAQTITTGVGADTINGGAGNDTITGGAGADVLSGGADADTFVITGANQSVVSSARTLTATVAAADSITFATGTAGTVDKITDFVAGTDKLDVTTANNAGTNIVGLTAATALTAGTTYVGYGSYNATTGVFTLAAAFDATTAKDVLVVVGDGTQTLANEEDFVVLTGLTQALAAADFV